MSSQLNVLTAGRVWLEEVDPWGCDLEEYIVVPGSSLPFLLPPVISEAR